MSGFTHPELVTLLRCPFCDDTLTKSGNALTCPRAHSFDLSRQGHVNLLGGRGAGQGDTAAMVEQRERVFAAGQFTPLAKCLTTLVEDHLEDQTPGPILDAGAGPGYYLAHVLNSCPDRFGLALDLSVPAAKRAAKVHDRIGSVVADTRTRLPVDTGCLAAVLDVFAPRNAAEFARVLRPDGVLLVATPAPDHLTTLLSTVAKVSVDPSKPQRLRESLSPTFRLRREEQVRWVLALSPRSAAEIVAMGPTGHHLAVEAIRERLSVQPQWTTEAAVNLTVWQPIS